MKRIPRRVKQQLGRRGMMLLTLGITYVLVAVGVMLRPQIPIPYVYHLHIPKPGNAALWVAAGVIACVFAWRRSDAAGWAALYIPPAIRISSYVGGWIVWLVTGVGYPGGWYAALLHLPFVLVALICAGWPERSHPPSSEDPPQ